MIERTKEVAKFDEDNVPVLKELVDKVYREALSSNGDRMTGDLQFADAKNVVLDTTTGTKIGTATSQKLGFYNATPVVQQTGCVVPTDLAEAITAITALRTALNNLGITTVET